ncbi:hypothetical protein DSM14862_03956 (plasmid) [Sulfitobacter indolifex]|nr:hypothetical protein DSM14862_03956 [Sulfitobacter indolifex]
MEGLASGDRNLKLILMVVCSVCPDRMMREECPTSAANCPDSAKMAPPIIIPEPMATAPGGVMLSSCGRSQSGFLWGFASGGYPEQWQSGDQPEPEHRPCRPPEVTADRLPAEMSK